VNVHDDGENRLEGDWETPLYITAGIVESQAHPIAAHDSLSISLRTWTWDRAYETNQSTRQDDKRASLMRLGALGLI